jgi:60 kDa SS-A/Ro ribonucleoprotein
MASLNVKNTYANEVTHEGATAKRISVDKQLRRSVLSCLLWENSFYEDGVDIAERIADLVKQSEKQNVFDLAYEARTKFKLRHVPLLLLREAARGGAKVSDPLYKTIQRADEIAEFLAIYWKDGKQPLSAQVKKGLGRAFNKFDEYQLAKYSCSGKLVSLRDALFLSHAKPENEEKAKLFEKLVNGTLSTPDTWETNLSGGADKKETFTRLIQERKLGALALLRNLRNMISAGVDSEVVIQAIRTANYEKVLPFRFIAAERYAPQYSSVLEEAMLKSISQVEKLGGKTIILVDVSGSMGTFGYLRDPNKSELLNIDKAAALAILLREISDTRVFIFNDACKEIPNRRGFALRDSIVNSLGGGTRLGNAVRHVNSIGYDRLIVITDEQTSDSAPNPTSNKSYMINIASYKNGVGYGNWNHIDGFSEAVIEYITEYEKEF